MYLKKVYPGIFKIILGPVLVFLLRKEEEEGKNNCSKFVLDLASIVLLLLLLLQFSVTDSNEGLSFHCFRDYFFDLI